MDHLSGYRRPLQKMFMDVSSSYDLMNRLLTFHLDMLWRRKAARECLKYNPKTVLDLCCGTGDLLFQLRLLASHTTEIVGLDYSESMLERARQKATKRKLADIIFCQGDAADIPFADKYFDVVGIAFAFRNLSYHNPDSSEFISEILRVLRPGGRFVIIETSQPENKMIRMLFHLYMKYIAAPVGGLISGHYGAYKYLAYSAINYYNRHELKEMLLNAGFSKVESRAFCGGITGLFIATR